MSLTAAQQDWFDSAIPASQDTEREYDVPASVTLAQAILESGWGVHHIGDANNYFGIKAFTVAGNVSWGDIAVGYVTVPTRETVDGQSVVVEANFRSYSSMTDSFRDHGAFLRNNGRYTPAFDHTDDGVAFARAVAAAGYATAPAYGDQLVALITSLDLTQYDHAWDAADDPGGTDDPGAVDDLNASDESDAAEPSVPQ